METLTRKERDKQLRQSDILKAAEHVFANKGFYKATIKDIAVQAQYATGTVYLYFKDKESLYKALFNKKLNDLLCRIKDSIKEDQNPMDQLKTFILICMDHFKNNQDFFILLEENKNLVDDCKNSPSHVEPQFQSIVIPIIQKAQKQKLISSKYECTLLSSLFTSSIKTVITYFLHNVSEKIDKSLDLSSVVYDFFLNGAANKGTETK